MAMEQIKIGETIRELRRKRNIAQEVLSQALNISVQAVSKWETGASLPDVLLLPDIARFFGITIDQLYYGIPEDKTETTPVPDGVYDDGKLRIVQFLGARCLEAGEWQEGKTIRLDIEKLDKWLEQGGRQLHMEIWGSTDIQGNISGGVEAGGTVSCGNVSGGLDANGGVNCGNVSGGVDVCGNVNCGNISGGADISGLVSCDTISGGVETSGDIHCTSIDGNAAISCETLYCRGDIRCKTIEGEVHHEGAIHFPD